MSAEINFDEANWTVLRGMKILSMTANSQKFKFDNSALMKSAATFIFIHAVSIKPLNMQIVSAVRSEYSLQIIMRSIKYRANFDVPIVFNSLLITMKFSGSQVENNNAYMRT